MNASAGIAHMRHASLFSGIGGPEVAAAMMGWENVFHCEINPFGRAVLEYWLPDSRSYDDIAKTSFTEWRGKVDILTGGFPCQPFSYAGKRRGREDERYLWPEMLRAIDEIRPAWVVGENVAGIATMVEGGGVLADMGYDGSLFGAGDGLHRYELRQSFTIERICRDLEGLGYSVQPVLIPAAAVGAPHRRDRIFIIAHSDERGDSPQGTDSAGDRQRADNVPGKAGQGEGHAPVGVDGLSAVQRNASSPDCEGLQTTLQPRGDDKKGWKSERRYAFLASDDAWGEGTWWDNFPTVSPVHRGDDGLPFSMDDLAISPTRWRTESLKAYGNAIVPQVMYEIFRAIEIAESVR